jgi:hypothetical protein
MKISVNICSVLIILTTACVDKKDDERTIQALSESLQNSWTTINNFTGQRMLSLEEKLEKPETRSQAIIWKMKADKVREYFSQLSRQIENSKSLKKLPDSVSNQLHDRLTSIRLEMQKIDSGFRSNLWRDPFLKQIHTTSKTSFRSWFDQSSILTLSNLLRIQHGVAIIENKLVGYCYENVGLVDGEDSYTSYSAIVGQSSKYIRPGEEIEILAGMGKFDLSAKPRFIFNGQEYLPGEHATAIYKFKAPRTPGNYKVDVVIQYTDVEGKKQSMTKKVEYTVHAVPKKS